MENKLKTTALAYHDKGFSVIALRPQNKMPIVTEWQKYCITRSTREEIESWWNVTPNANIGIACGPANGQFLFVIDQDVLKNDQKVPILNEDGSFKQRGDISGCPATVTQTSGSGGRQLFYWAPKGYEVKSYAGIRHLVDVRGVGGQVVVPPSIHPNGNEYTWDVEDLDQSSIAEFPREALEAFLGDREKTKLPISTVLAGLPVGNGLRHTGMAQVAGYYLQNAKTQAEVEMARVALYAWDKEMNKSPERFEERKVELDNTFEGILKLHIAEKELNQSEKINTERFRVWSLGEIMEHDFGEEEWLVESLISKQGITALSGNPGDFKTWVTIHIALSISRNMPVFGKFPVSQGSVLVIDEEDHLRLLKKRLESLGAKETDPIHYLSQNGIKMDVEAVRDEILEIVKEKNIKLLILDSLVRVHQQDENDAKGMAKVFSGLQKIINAGASILFTHHHRKQQGFGANNSGQSMRGSSDILAVVDCHMTIERKRDGEDRLIIKQSKLRQAELLKPFEISVLKGDLGPSGFEYAGDYEEKKIKAEEASVAIVSVLKEGMLCRTEIIEALKGAFGKTACEDGLKIAEEGEIIERVPKEELLKEQKRKAYYQLSKVSIPVDEFPGF